MYVAAESIANQGATLVMKLDDGKLAYNILTEKPAELGYNTLTTRAAGQFEVLLPNGSKVWLNNASSLRNPLASTERIEGCGSCREEWAVPF